MGGWMLDKHHILDIQNGKNCSFLHHTCACVTLRWPLWVTGRWSLPWITAVNAWNRMKYGSSSHLQIIEESFEGPIIHSNDWINQWVSHQGARLAAFLSRSAILGRRRLFYCLWRLMLLMNSIMFNSCISSINVINSSFRHQSASLWSSSSINGREFVFVELVRRHEKWNMHNGTIKYKYRRVTAGLQHHKVTPDNPRNSERARFYIFLLLFQDVAAVEAVISLQV